jgi:broad specificity phosphatase PhoE
MILCAPSRRARQTAELIKHLSPKNPEIKQTDTLREISFDLEALTSEEQFAQKGLQEMRSALCRGVVRRESGAEPLENLLRRIDTLLEILEESQYNSILCVTHSFFMRVLRLYFLEYLTHSQDITVDQLMNAYDHSYLDGFTLTLEKSNLVAV